VINVPKRSYDVEIEEDVHFEEGSEEDQDWSVSDFTVKDEDEDVEEVATSRDDEGHWDDY
jgi:hypothetical protein